MTLPWDSLTQILHVPFCIGNKKERVLLLHERGNVSVNPSKNVYFPDIILNSSDEMCLEHLLPSVMDCCSIVNNHVVVFHYAVNQSMF